MASDNFKNTVFGLVLFIGFAWLILSVAVGFGNEYGRSADEIGNGSLNLVDFQSVANSVEGNASSFRQGFEDGTVDDIDDPSGMFGTAKKIISLITAPFTLISQIMANILGVPTLIIDIVLGLLAIGLILGIWSVLRSGS